MNDKTNWNPSVSGVQSLPIFSFRVLRIEPYGYSNTFVVLRWRCTPRLSRITLSTIWRTSAKQRGERKLSGECKASLEISSHVQVLFRGIGHSSVRHRSLWRERSTTISDQSWSIIEILSHCQTNTRILSGRQLRRSVEVLSIDESVRSFKTCFCRARYYCRHCHFGQRPETIHKCIHYRTEGKLN